MRVTDDFLGEHQMMMEVGDLGPDMPVQIPVILSKL